MDPPPKRVHLMPWSKLFEGTADDGFMESLAGATFRRTRLLHAGPHAVEFVVGPTATLWRHHILIRQDGDRIDAWAAKKPTLLDFFFHLGAWTLMLLGNAEEPRAVAGALVAQVGGTVAVPAPGRWVAASPWWVLGLVALPFAVMGLARLMAGIA